MFGSLCHVFGSLCQMFGSLCQMFGSLCHMFGSLCHVFGSLCHMFGSLFSNVWFSLSHVWFSLSNVWFSSSPTKYSHSKLSLSQKCCICHTATSSPQEIDSITQLTQPEVEVLVDVTRTAPYNPHSPQVFRSQYSKSETLLNGLFSFEYHTLN